jgi:phosphonate transport system ATP-binding protein
MITIEGLKKSYAGRPVLQGIDLTAKAGEFLVVLGPSGAGKSTLLRCINGLTQPDAGRIVIDGTVFDSTRANRHQRPVAMSSSIIIWSSACRCSRMSWSGAWRDCRRF